MRILHTADWHLGKVLKGVDRTPEIAAALDELLALVKDERIDAVIAAGDLFDHPNPGAEAEAAFYRFLAGLKALGVPLVGVAGNHDSRSRLEALAPVLKHLGARLVGELRFFEEGGVVDLLGMRVAAVPFLSERRLIKGAELLEEDPGASMQRYAGLMGRLFQNLAQGFEPGAINLMVGHLTVDGAALGGGEFKLYVGQSYAVPATAFPPEATYVALGHIHRQQQVGDVAWYAGSLVQLDFGEHEAAPRGALVVELEPGRPPRVEPIGGFGKPLRTFRFDLAELDRRMEEVAAFPGYARLIVRGRGDAALRARILRAHPHVLEVAFEAEGEEAQPLTVPEALSWSEAYARYHQETYGEPPDAALKKAFEEALEAAHAAD